MATVFAGTRAAGKQELTWAPDAIPDGWYRLTLTAVAGAKQVQTSTRVLGRPHARRDDRERAGVLAERLTGRSDADASRSLNPAHVEVARPARLRRVAATLLEADLGPGRSG